MKSKSHSLLPLPFLGLATLLLAGASLHAEDIPGAPSTPVAASTQTAAPATEKRFFRAAGETIIIGWSPWVWSHYVKDYDYADISMDSVRRNFSNPPWWDADSFHTNMWGHPFQGSIYFNAARENGFSFWEAAPFVALGDFGWEYFMEAEPPSYNDFSNTFFGGMSRGEMTHRLSRAIRDNRAHGWDKFWREFFAGIVNPVGFIDRAVFGDMWKESDNPPDRYPSKLTLVIDGGFARGRDSSAYPKQGQFNIDLRYNDPHETRIHKPFDAFDMQATISTADGPLIPWIFYRGLLAGWETVDESDVHHMVAPALSFNYFNNGPSSFGGSGLDLLLFSRWKIPKEFEIRTEAGAQAFIAAGIQTDYLANNVNAYGRNYDFGSGGGPKLDFRLRRKDVDWFRVTGTIGWFITHNGLSSENRIALVTTEARYPLTESLYAGVGWSFLERFTIYDDLPQSTRVNSTLKAFISWAFRAI